MDEKPWERVARLRKEKLERLAFRKVISPEATVELDFLRRRARRGGLEFESCIRTVKAFNMKIQVRVCAAWRKEATDG